LRRIFAPDGLLARALPQSGRDWEDRAEQREMAQAVARAVDEKHHLLVEAGTGTGKATLSGAAYLWAVANNKKISFATHTKALQQQLVERDMPFCATCFLRRMGTEFRFALCLGAQNYICPRRLPKPKSADCSPRAMKSMS
jgi:ATP-dependent DNA helicase DinG